MSEQSAADVIAAHGKLDCGFRCECGWEVSPHLSIIYREHESHVLAALEAAGYAVVKLPSVAHKGPYDTDAKFFRQVADRMKATTTTPISALGGSNVRHAVRELLYRAADAAESLAAAREADNA